MHRQTVLLTGAELQPLLALAMELGPANLGPTIVEAHKPVQSLLHHPHGGAHIAVVYMDGAENVAEVRQVLAAHRSMRFVFLAPAFPPDAAMARVVAEYGGAILRRKESAMVIVGTIVAMLTQAQASAS